MADRQEEGEGIDWHYCDFDSPHHITRDRLATEATLKAAWRAGRNSGYAEGFRVPAPLDVDELAQIIREVDGDHSLGAGALAEAIVARLRPSTGPAPLYVDGNPHYDQNGNLLENYHVCGCQPPSLLQERMRARLAVEYRLDNNRDAVLTAILDEVCLPEREAQGEQPEAEGHIVDFTDSGFGLQHPPSCRPDLINCRFNQYLTALGYPDEEPGRYRMALHKGHAEYARLSNQPSTEPKRNPHYDIPHRCPEDCPPASFSTEPKR